VYYKYFGGFERIGFVPNQTKRGRRHFVCFGSTGEFTGKKKMKSPNS
jgi:hypothetical protein